jgi:diguanylate cyclase
VDNRETATDDEPVITAPPPARVALAATYLPTILDNADALAADFYATLMERGESHRYLSNDDVQTRLKAELVRWLDQVFSTESFTDVAAFEARQHQIGQIHARLRIPIHLVNLAAARLRAQISELVRARTDQPWADRFDVMRFLDEWIDGAITAMSRSGIRRIVDRTRLEESYRLFALDQDMNLERERQRASLLEWSQSTLLAAVNGASDIGPLSLATFGRWIRHRAELMFGTAPQLREISDAIAHVDNDLLPAVHAAERGDRGHALAALGAQVEAILALLGDMFAGLSELEVGRDALTRTLNRRFLPSILLREIGFAARTGMSLCGLMIDVDNFKDINDAHGHHAGDAALRTLATILADRVRSTDFVFRYGGEEFFVLLVETDLRDSVATAEAIRTAVAETPIMSNQTRMEVTVSIGVAAHDGHPDPDELVRRADTALARAKRDGRNRVATR